MYSFDFSPPMAWQLLDELAKCTEALSTSIQLERSAMEERLRSCFDCIEAYALGLAIAARPALSVIHRN